MWQECIGGSSRCSNNNKDGGDRGSKSLRVGSKAEPSIVALNQRSRSKVAFDWKAPNFWEPTKLALPRWWGKYWKFSFFSSSLGATRWMGDINFYQHSRFNSYCSKSSILLFYNTIFVALLSGLRGRKNKTEETIFCGWSIKGRFSSFGAISQQTTTTLPLDIIGLVDPLDLDSRTWH